MNAKNKRLALTLLVLGLLFGFVAFLSVHNTPSSGSMAIVVMHPEAETGKQGAVALDAGHGYSETLQFPFASSPSGTFISIPATKVESIQFSETPSREWRQAASDDKTIRTRIIEFSPDKAPTASLNTAVSDYVTAAPGPILGANEGTNKLFFVSQESESGVRAGWTRTYFELSAWVAPTYYVRKIMLRGFGGTNEAVFRLSLTNGEFIPLRKTNVANEYSYRSIHTADTRIDTARKIATIMVAALLVLVAIPAISIYSTAKNLIQEGKRKAVCTVFLSITTWCVLIVILAWPTVIGWDAFFPITQHGTGGLWMWYGIGYPMLTSALLNIQGLEIATLLRVVIFYLTLLWVSLQCLKSGVPLFAVSCWIMVGAAFSTTSVIVATELRDSVNAIGLAAFGTFIYGIIRRKSPIQLAEYFSIVLAGCALTLIRIDNVPFLAATVAGIALIYRNRTNYFFGTAACIVWIFTNTIAQTAIYGKDEAIEGEKRLYQVSAVINPLTGYLQSQNVSRADKQRLENTLSGFLDVEYARTRWNPFGIVYWHEKNKGIPSPQAIQRLKSEYVYMLKKYPLTFIQMRAATLLAMLRQPRLANRVIDNFNYHRDPDKFILVDHITLDLPNNRKLLELAGLTRLTHISQEKTAAALRWYASVSTHFIPIIIVVAIAALTPIVPASGILGLAVLARVGGFFVFAPAAMYMYVAELQIFWILLPLLAAAEWKARTRETANLL